jgi:hypothetical protein
MGDSIGAASSKCVAFVALGAVCAAGPIHAVPAAADNPYAPLQLYDGGWIVESSDGKTTHVENHCARTGLFFACEQVVNGKPEALVVFLPRGRTEEGQTYRTQALKADAGPPAPWYHLVIDGEHWVYSAGADKDKHRPLHERTVNDFSGPDRIRFAVQTSKDGKTWTTTLRGEERRAR